MTPSTAKPSLSRKTLLDSSIWGHLDPPDELSLERTNVSPDAGRAELPGVRHRAAELPLGEGSYKLAYMTMGVALHATPAKLATAVAFRKAFLLGGKAGPRLEELGKGESCGALWMQGDHEEAELQASLAMDSFGALV